MTSKTLKTNLGTLTPLGPVDFSQQLWVQVERNDGGVYTTVGTRTKLALGPYALWSETSEATGPHTHEASDINSGTLNNSYFSAYSDLSAEGYLDNNSGTDLLMRSQADARYVNENQETDPQVGTLTNGKWCSTDGSAVNCIQEPPASTNHNHNSSYVNATGDKMSGVLELPLNGLVAGTNQLVLYNGDVGIGTPTPKDELHVLGPGYLQAVFESKDSSGGIQLVSGNGQKYELQSLTDGGFILYDRNDSRYVLRVNTAGNVGIGTVTPGAKLDVSTTASEGKAVRGTATGTISIGVEGHGTHAGGYFKNANGTGQAFLGFKYQGTADYGIQTWSNHIGCWCQGDNGGGMFDDTDSGGHVDVCSATYKILGNGSVDFVQNHPNEKDKVIVYAAPEGDEVATYTRGTARLIRGEARVQLGETFKWVTNPDIGLTAHLTPRGDCKGLYVESLSTNELVVRELQGGTSNIVFDYIVYGLRIGFEEVSVVQEKEREAYIPSMASHRERYNKNPELRHYNAQERFKDMSADIGKPVDLSDSKVLRDAIIEFDPTVHKVSRP